MANKILCATDGSHSAEKAVDVAIDLAKGLDAELTFPDGGARFRGAGCAPGVLGLDVLDAADAQVSRELHAARGKAKAAGLERVRCVITYGHNITAAIIQYAEKHGHDHIVTGLSG